MQVPNITRTEYTLLDVNDEGFVSNRAWAMQLQQRTGEQQQSALRQCPTLRPGGRSVCSSSTCYAVANVTVWLDAYTRLAPQQRWPGSSMEQQASSYNGPLPYVPLAQRTKSTTHANTTFRFASGGAVWSQH